MRTALMITLSFAVLAGLVTAASAATPNGSLAGAAGNSRQLIPQPSLNGVPQDPIVITPPAARSSAPLPFAIHNLVEAASMPGGGAPWLMPMGDGDPSENQSYWAEIETADSTTSYTVPIQAGACQMLIWETEPWTIPNPSVRTQWSFVCSLDVVWGLNSCIVKNAYYETMGCNRPRQFTLKAGWGAAGNTATKCIKGTWRYHQYLWLMTNLGAGGGAGPVRSIYCFKTTGT